MTVESTVVCTNPLTEYWSLPQPDRREVVIRTSNADLLNLRRSDCGGLAPPVVEAASWPHASVVAAAAGLPTLQTVRRESARRHPTLNPRSVPEVVGGGCRRGGRDQ
jgi:hypothetical protein